MSTITFYSHNSLLFLLLLSPAFAIHFQIDRFDPNNSEILYGGDAVPRVGAAELNNRITYLFQAGSIIYGESMLIWDSTSGKVTDFTTHFTFFIDIQGKPNYASGLAFFLAPSGFQMPPNSAGGFLGLFNTTLSDSSQNHIVHVEFDTFENPEWDPPGVGPHVSININSVSSSIYTPWNVSLHSGDTADVWIAYNATTKNLSVSWNFRTTSVINSGENTTLSYPVDLVKVLPQWSTIGFSAATGYYVERHVIQSWEFNSTFDETNNDASGKKRKGKTLEVVIIIGSVIGGVVLIVGAGVITYVIFMRCKMMKRNGERRNMTSIDDDDLERGVGPRRFSYKELVMATNNFSTDRKLGEGGFGAVYRGYFPDSDMTVAVKRISKGSKQGKKEYLTEVKVISRLRHRNLVQLKGWCHDKKGELMLVYEFMPNGSLDSQNSVLVLQVFGKLFVEIHGGPDDYENS